MRSVFDPKHFYKKDKSLDQIRKVEIGRVIDSPIDYYSSRLPKKFRKKTLMDELLADAEFRKRNKRKFLEIIEQKKRTHARAKRYDNRLKRRNKRRN
ncbi:hypothetical protein AAG570_011185 [Ranatra chinensis]|uniref:Fcf2 pre-rRNA processing C-terminal domain-containing protein n=1 Tax=Ranatra chinensis TaxID=642074 RepID=A0ABD0YJW8_9HEMI